MEMDAVQKAVRWEIFNGCFSFLFTARGASLADFIQPSLVQLQPNLDDYMDMLEPLHGN